MICSPTNVVILGSTGTIGRNTLQVVAASDGRLRVVGLAAHRRCSLLAEQAAGRGPVAIVVVDPAAAAAHDWSALPGEVQLSVGREALDALVRRSDIDVVVAAIVGSAGLASTCAALEAGKRVALANKETLVMAGPLVMRLAAGAPGSLIPVDSEHSAIFQALAAGSSQEVRRVVLTASGGPFRRHTAEQMAAVTVADALRHPTWDMGPKITVDSATMMNKALEIVEARWLFGLRPDQISVMIHPQSIVHSMVEFVDGSVVAQLSPPDMKLPIQYALDYPLRRPGVAAKMDWTRSHTLEFEPPDGDRFPALSLGMEVAAAGGTAGAVLNAANEQAVAAFLAGELPFVDIVPACRRVLEQHDFEPAPSLDRLIELDGWARQEVLRWACAS